MLTVLHIKSAPDIFLMYLITDCDVMASAQANALTDFNAEGCCGKCIFRHWTTFSIWTVYFKMLDLFVVWFFYVYCWMMGALLLNGVRQ